jgi:hypothetical protein
MCTWKNWASALLTAAIVATTLLLAAPAEAQPQSRLYG